MDLERLPVMDEQMRQPNPPPVIPPSPRRPCGCGKKRPRFLRHDDTRHDGAPLPAPPSPEGAVR